MEQCPHHSEIAKRLDRCEEEICKLKEKDTEFLVKQAKMDEKLDNLIIMLKEVRDKVEEMSRQPGKRWDTVVTTIITAAVSMGVGALIARLLS